MPPGYPQAHYGYGQPQMHMYGGPPGMPMGMHQQMMHHSGYPMRQPVHGQQHPMHPPHQQPPVAAASPATPPQQQFTNSLNTKQQLSTESQPPKENKPSPGPSQNKTPPIPAQEIDSWEEMADDETPASTQTETASPKEDVPEVKKTPAEENSSKDDDEVKSKVSFREKSRSKGDIAKPALQLMQVTPKAEDEKET